MLFHLDEDYVSLLLNFSRDEKDEGARSFPLEEPATVADDDVPRRFVVPEASTVVVALVPRGLEWTGDARLRATERSASPIACFSSWRLG
jgi:hypothetical protein